MHRHHFFRAASSVLLGCTLALMAGTTTQLRSENKIPDEYKQGGFAIGSQAYTFNRFTAFEAIEKTAQAGGRVIEFYPGQRLSKEDQP